ALMKPDRNECVSVLVRAFARIGCRSRTKRDMRFQQAGQQFADVEFAPWRAKQGGEALQAARGFQKSGVAVIPNRPVVVLTNKGRFLVWMKGRTSRQRVSDAFDQGFREFSVIRRAVVEGFENAGHI